MSPLFALIDCNNFFVSCERIFRPDLEGRPVVVLSSNDGCAVARSNEAKALGIPMGAPAFKYRELFKAHSVQQFSANFELYGDISERITRILTSITPHTEVYSVDESFLDLRELNITDYTAWGEAVRARILREVGVPVSIGIAGSKTLAKLASERAKHDPLLPGVLDYAGQTAEAQACYLRETPIGDVWGVGRRLSPKLKSLGLFTALDLARTRPQLGNQVMGVHGKRLIAELNGISTEPLEPLAKIRKSVMHGRMFGADTNQFSVIEAAIASLTARACYHLRSEELLAQQAIISLSTNRHKPGYEHFSRFITFQVPTADTGNVTAQLVKAVESIYRPNTPYHRANVLLDELVETSSVQTDLFAGLSELTSAQARLSAVDALNARYGKNTVHFAAEDLSDAWQPKRDYRSPRYTTSWAELPGITKPI